MKLLRFIVLEALFLIAMALCGTATMQVMALLRLACENIWTIGFKVGFMAWLALNILTLIRKRSDRKRQ